MPEPKLYSAETHLLFARQKSQSRSDSAPQTDALIAIALVLGEIRDLMKASKASPMFPSDEMLDEFRRGYNTGRADERTF